MNADVSISVSVQPDSLSGDRINREAEMSLLSNHQPEILDSRRCPNPQSEDEELMRLDFASGMWFEDDVDYDSEEYEKYAAQEEERILASLRSSGVCPF